MAYENKIVHPVVSNSAYCKAFGRLDETLEKYEPDDSEKTELLGRRIFGHLWDDLAESSAQNGAIYPGKSG